MKSTQRFHPAFALLLPGAAVAALGLSFGIATIAVADGTDREPHTVQEDLDDTDDPEGDGGEPVNNPNPFLRDSDMRERWWHMYSRVTPWEVPQMPQSRYYFRVVPVDAELLWPMPRQTGAR